MTLLLQAWQTLRETKYAIYMLTDYSIFCARSCTENSRSVEYVHLQFRIRASVYHDEASEALPITNSEATYDE